MSNRSSVGFQGRFDDAPHAIDCLDGRNSNPVTHAEVIDRLRVGHIVEATVIEDVKTPEDGSPLYLLYVKCDWSESFRVFHVYKSARPRFFRDLDRLVGMIRIDFGYLGQIDLRINARWTGNDR